MLQTIRNAWKVADLRKKILFTLFILLIYRFGGAIPIPGINLTVVQSWFTAYEDTILGLLNALSGGGLSSATVFALSIQPYINASIILQLLSIAIPALERLRKEGGEEGKRKIERITRYMTIGLALLQGFGYYSLLNANGAINNPGVWTALVIVMTFTAGAAFVMWLGEQITEHGIGNGISMILFASIVSRVPSMVSTLISAAQAKAISWILFAGIIIGILIEIIFIVYVDAAERRLPVQYAKRVVGRKMYGGQATTLPIKVNMTGVIPIIFAQAIVSFPATIAAFLPKPAEGSFWAGLLDAISNQSVLYAVVYLLLIVGFSYFYATVQFNPVEISNNLKKNGGFIPGFRPGKPTSDFIKKVLNKMTLFGAIFLGILAVLPIILSHVVPIEGFSISGTSILIMVGVALETTKQLEGQMMMRHYKGFLE